MKSTDYKELLVWQKSIELVKFIYLILTDFPKDERYNIIDQIKRAAISVPSNIAEGQSREYTKDFIHFLFISRGSLAELETQFIISKELGMINENILEDLLIRTKEINKMIGSLIDYLRKSLKK